jgi:hypothetical protein
VSESEYTTSRTIRVPPTYGVGASSNSFSLIVVSLGTTAKSWIQNPDCLTRLVRRQQQRQFVDRVAVTVDAIGLHYGCAAGSVRHQDGELGECSRMHSEAV